MDKVFVITRNPIDVFPSKFLLYNIGSHSLTCEENISEAFPVEWDQWIRSQVHTFKQYHAFLIDRLAKNVPVYFCRYEDQTTTHANRNLTELFQFFLDQPSIEGTVAKHRID